MIGDGAKTGTNAQGKPARKAAAITEQKVGKVTRFTDEQEHSVKSAVTGDTVVNPGQENEVELDQRKTSKELFGAGSSVTVTSANGGQSAGSREVFVSPGSNDSGVLMLPDEHSGHKPKKNPLHRKSTFSGKSTLPRSNTLSSGAPSEELDETEDSINVVVRVRPLSKQETERRDKNCIEFPGDGALHIDLGLQNKTFTFNVTFEPEANQGDVFEHSGIKKLIDMALNGYACTAFAFGQTGSGKTHTITGPPEMYQEKTKMKEELTGLIPRSFRYLLQQMNVQKGNAFRITASYLEIYNEQVVDLLNTNMRQHLSVRWSKHRGFYVENLFVIECETLDDLMAVLEEGLKNRQTGSNSVNEESSRSHSLLTLQIDSEMQDPEDESLYITKHGKLTFVDLAGSEKVKDTAQATSEHWVESNNINKSLLVLGNCIAALGDPKRRQGHIPYRDSKLTKLLADSLGGSGVTLMIACVTPSSYNGAESMNTLRYANRAKKIKNKPTVKMDPREALIMSLKREVKILRQENHYLRQQLEFPVKPRGKLQKENDEKFLKMVKEQGKVEDGKTEGAVGESTKTTGENVKITDNGLYEMLQEYMIENETLRSENSHIHQVKDQSAREQQFMAMENERLQRKLEEIERQRVYMNTPMSIHSLASTTTSRRSSAMDTQYPQDPTPLGTPYWGQPHDMPYGSQPYGYQQYGGSQPYGTNQVGYYREPPPGSWQPEMTRPTDLPLGPEPSPRPQNGYTPPGGPSSKRTPPTHLQHPMKPPHRLAEPVMRPSQGGNRGADSSYSSQYQREQDYQRVHPPLAGPAAGQTPRGQVPMGGTPGQPKGQQRAPPPVSYQQQYQQRNSPNVPNWDPLPAGQPPQPTPRRSKASSQASIQSQPALSPRRTASENNETETYQDMNDRLRQELVDLENQIRTQQQLSSPTKAAAGSGATGGKR